MTDMTKADLFTPLLLQCPHSHPSSFDLIDSPFPKNLIWRPMHSCPAGDLLISLITAPVLIAFVCFVEQAANPSA